MFRRLFALTAVITVYICIGFSSGVSAARHSVAEDASSYNPFASTWLPGPRVELVAQNAVKREEVPVTNEQAELENSKESASKPNTVFEYELLERITNHNQAWLDRVILYGTSFIAVLGLVGFFAVVKLVGDRAIETVRKEVHDDTKTLKEAVEKNLADLRITAREYESESKRISTLITELEADAAKVRTELESDATQVRNKIAADAAKVQGEIESFRLTVSESQGLAQRASESVAALSQVTESALERAESASKRAESSSQQAAYALEQAQSASRLTSNLTGRVSDGLAGIPVVYQFEVAPIEVNIGAEFLIPYKFEGANLGSEPGSVSIIGFETRFGEESKRFLLDENEFNWSENSIEFSAISEDTTNALKDWVASVRAGYPNEQAHPEETIGFTPIVELKTHSGMVITVQWSDY